MNTREEFRDREYLNPEIKEMLFALGLIQSYGSGIRRAKHAMAENGNPPLFFEPANDTDDYTMVTCPINEEFAYIRDHEDETTNMVLQKTTSNAQETTDDAQETTSNAQEAEGNAQETVDTLRYSETKLAKYRCTRSDFLVAMTGNTIGKVGRMINGFAYANQLYRHLALWLN